MAHIINIPLVPLMPSSSNSAANEIAFKTIPSATKVEIKQLLQSFYGLEVQKVRTLNMKGKKKRMGVSRTGGPSLDYKKAYVTLKNPLSFYSMLYPSPATSLHQDKDKKKMMALQF